MTALARSASVDPTAPAQALAALWQKFRAMADGTGWTGVDTGADSNWVGPRVDDTAVYYFHAGALLKRLK